MARVHPTLSASNAMGPQGSSRYWRSRCVDEASRVRTFLHEQKMHAEAKPQRPKGEGQDGPSSSHPLRPIGGPLFQAK